MKKYNWLIKIIGIVLFTVIAFYGTIIYMFNKATGELVEEVQSIAHDDENESFRNAIDSTKTLIESELEYPIIEKIINSKDQ